MRLFKLPDELLDAIALSTKTQSDLNELARTSRRLYPIAICRLYRRNAQGYGSSALRWAAKHGVENTTRSALDSGASTEARGKNDETPRLLVAREGHVALVRLIFNVHCDDIDVPDYDESRTPLFWAARHGHDEIVGLLLAD